MKVLVTGGAGYIGSTVVTALEAAGHTAVILDSLLTGASAFVGDRAFYKGDVADRELLDRIFTDHAGIACTVHLAARTVVPESFDDPIGYYENNVVGTFALAEHLRALGMPRLVFSSSAAVYGRQPTFEFDESAALAPMSPYARTKVVAEWILEDIARAGGPGVIALRYFNPIGSDPGLRTGLLTPESSSVAGQLDRVCRGLQDYFFLTGIDLPTRDGTGLRDYIHVWDIARAHVAAVENFDSALDRAGTSFVALNLGTGVAVTVRELVSMFERASGRQLQVREMPARPGDIVGAYATVERVRELLGWNSELTVEEAVRSALAWGLKRREVLGYD